MGVIACHVKLNRAGLGQAQGAQFGVQAFEAARGFVQVIGHCVIDIQGLEQHRPTVIASPSRSDAIAPVGRNVDTAQQFPVLIVGHELDTGLDRAGRYLTSDQQVTNAFIVGRHRDGERARSRCSPQPGWNKGHHILQDNGRGIEAKLRQRWSQDFVDHVHTHVAAGRHADQAFTGQRNKRFVVVALNDGIGLGRIL